jgi:hypothetical protein
MSAKSGQTAWLSAFAAFDISIVGLLVAPHVNAGSFDLAMATKLLSVVLAPAAILLLGSLMSADLKSAIVFWRVKDVLPGHRAFSKYMALDVRINIEKLKSRLGELPETPESQQAEWYRIYRLHHQEPAVIDANKRFLLFRDLASVSALVAMIIPAIFWVTAQYEVIRPAAVVFAIQYVLGAIAAQLAGIRLVKTVLAIESAA